MKEINVLIAEVLAPDADPADRHSAFGEVVARFQNMAFACAYAMLKDYYLAEDAAQEAFIVAWQRLDQLKDPKAFPGWLKQVVFSQCHRLTRGKRLLVVPLEPGLSLPAGGPDPHVLAEQRELSEKVRAAIKDLPEGERMVTTLFYIDGYSQNDIGDFLELPVTTVAKRLFSARRRLKQGLVDMVEEDLKHHRPSRDDGFVARVQAKLRPLAERDWGGITSIACGVEPRLREDSDRWLRERQQFDERKYTRRHYVAQHADSGQILGYGAVEQTIFLPKYRLFLVVAPAHLRGGVGGLLLDRLMKDLREVNAIVVWHRGDDRQADGSAFLKEHGFVETGVTCELRLPLNDFDAAPFGPLAARVAAGGISIRSYAEERERDPEHLRKLHDLLNLVMADEQGRQPFAPVPLDTVARWFSRQSLLPDACFIAKQGGPYIGMTSLSLLGDGSGGVAHGFTGVLRDYRRQGVATALKLRAIEYARWHGYPFTCAFNDSRNVAALALNEKLGFRRHVTSVTLEKCLKEVKPVDPAVYDAYVGRYAFDPEHLKAHDLPAGLTVTVKRVGPRLISEVRDMQDELLPESETRFFITMHYGEVEFIRGRQGQAKGLIYRESGKEMRATRVE